MTAIWVWVIEWWKTVSVVVQHSRNDDKNWTGNLIWSASTNSPAFTSIQLLLLIYKMKLHPHHFDYYYHFNAVSVYLIHVCPQMSFMTFSYFSYFPLLKCIEPNGSSTSWINLRVEFDDRENRKQKFDSSTATPLEIIIMTRIYILINLPLLRAIQEYFPLFVFGFSVRWCAFVIISKRLNISSTGRPMEIIVVDHSSRQLWKTKATRHLKRPD